MRSDNSSERPTRNLLVLVLLLFAIGFSVGAYYYYRSYKAQFRAEVERQLSAIVDLKASELALWRKERLGDANTFRDNAAFATLARRFFDNPQDHDARAQLASWLGQLQRFYQYDRIALYDERAIERIAVPASPERTPSLLARNVPEVLRAGAVTMVDFYREENDARVRLAVLIPVSDGPGGSRTLGVLALRMDPQSYLFPFINRWPTLSRTGETLLVRREGNEVVFLNHLRFQTNAALARRIALANTNVPAVRAVLGQEGVVDGVDYREVPVVAALRRIPESPWFMVARVDMAEVYAPLRERLWLLASLVGALLLGSGAGVGLIWRQRTLRHYHERFEAAKSLREIEEKHKRLIETTDTGYTIIDNQGRVVDANLEYVRLTGRERLGDVLGHSVLEWTAPHDLERNQAAVKRCAEQGAVRNLEIDYLGPDGRLIPVEINATVMRSRDVSVILSICRDITERKRAEGELRRLNDTLSAIVDASPVAIFALNVDGKVTQWSAAAERVFGWSESEVLGRFNPIVPEDKLGEFRAAFSKVTSGKGYTSEVRRRRKDGVLRDISISTAPLRDAAGKIIGAVGIMEDVTERKRAEEDKSKLQTQLHQSQKMESVGRLAGGVAHDFNNMLQAILGNVALALQDIPQDSPLRESLDEIHKSAQRSANLTRQLLAFARKQAIQPKVLDLNDTVAGMLKMLQRLIGEDILLTWLPSADLWPVKVDPSQIDQILANLCVNARDAIAGNGQVTIKTANVTLDSANVLPHPGCAPGDYVLLSVADTGQGMDDQTRTHLFEPFFTTKELGKGTGLGLATVFGAVKQNLGLINVDSKPGQGTTFSIYLPRTVADPAPAEQKLDHRCLRGTETILLVEDERQVLNLGRRILMQQGYTVLVASTPEAALALAAEHAGPIHLLVTDVVMPGMNGKELRDQLRADRPHMRCLFMSGYTANVIAHHGMLDEGVQFLQKPFSIQSLAEKVRDTLEQPLNP